MLFTPPNPFKTVKSCQKRIRISVGIKFSRTISIPFVRKRTTKEYNTLMILMQITFGTHLLLTQWLNPDPNSAPALQKPGWLLWSGICIKSSQRAKWGWKLKMNNLIAVVTCFINYLLFNVCLSNNLNVTWRFGLPWKASCHDPFVPDFVPKIYWQSEHRTNNVSD